MGGEPVQQDQDDFKIEITAIDEAATSDVSKDAKEVQSLLQPWFTPRQRRLQALLTVSLVLLALFILLGSIPSVRGVVLSFFQAPSPGATTSPDDLAPIYVAGNPPWGHLSIDRKLITHLPSIGEAPLYLAHGRHRLGWFAQPFRPQYCTLTMPFDTAHDTCTESELIQQAKGVSIPLFTFTDTIAQLSNDQQTLLVKVAQAALDTSQSIETVQPGEVYAQGCRNGQASCTAIVTARSSIQAKLYFQLDATLPASGICSSYGNTHADACRLNGIDCHLFCPTSFFSTTTWDVLGVTRTLWQYTGQDGRTIVQDQSDSLLLDIQTGQTRDEHLVTLQISWDRQGWHVAIPGQSAGGFDFPYSDPTCGAAEDRINVDTLLRDANLYHQSVNWLFLSGKSSAAGCLAIATPRQDAQSTPSTTTTPTFAPAAYCLYRFGVLLAANDLAHTTWPALPVADSHEQGIAQQIAASLLASAQ